MKFCPDCGQDQSIVVRQDRRIRTERVPVPPPPSDSPREGLLSEKLSTVEEERDPALPAKLRAELPGILRWAVEGCLRWQKEGLGEPEEVKVATAEYRAEMDVLASFIEERCVVKEGAWVKFSELYTEYEKWSQESGEIAEKKRSFGSRLKDRGFEPANGTGNVAIRLGIALRSARKPPDGGGEEPEKESKPSEDGGQEPEGGPESYSVNNSYPESGMTEGNDSSGQSTPKQVNCTYLVNSGDSGDATSNPLEAFLADPPSWFVEQARLRGT